MLFQPACTRRYYDLSTYIFVDEGSKGVSDAFNAVALVIMEKRGRRNKLAGSCYLFTREYETFDGHGKVGKEI